MNLVYSVKLGEATGSEPVSLLEAKSQLKIDFSTDDTLLTALITAARLQIEKITGVSLVARQVDLIAKLDGCHLFELPYGPLDTTSLIVTKLKVTPGGTDELLTTTDYIVRGDYFAQLHVANGDGMFAITYDAGYTVVPQALKEAILHQVSYLYEHRGDEDINGMSATAKALIMPFRRVVI